MGQTDQDGSQHTAITNGYTESNTQGTQRTKSNNDLPLASDLPQLVVISYQQ